MASSKPTKAELLAQVEYLSRRLQTETAVLRATEQQRDQALMQLASCHEERGCYRRQRDEAVQALAQLTGATP